MDSFDLDSASLVTGLAVTGVIAALSKFVWGNKKVQNAPVAPPAMVAIPAPIVPPFAAAWILVQALFSTIVPTALDFGPLVAPHSPAIKVRGNIFNGNLVDLHHGHLPHVWSLTGALHRLNMLWRSAKAVGATKRYYNQGWSRADALNLFRLRLDKAFSVIPPGNGTWIGGATYGIGLFRFCGIRLQQIRVNRVISNTPKMSDGYVEIDNLRSDVEWTLEIYLLVKALAVRVGGATEGQAKYLAATAFLKAFGLYYGIDLNEELEYTPADFGFQVPVEGFPAW